MKLQDMIGCYRDTLLKDVMPFWLKNGMDKKHGGIMTALDRVGSVVDTDKSVWFQGRAAWMFATLYNTIEPRKQWLEAAASCLNFARQHCYAESGKMYFTVTREGRPLRMRRYVYSECFAAIAFAAYAKATGDKSAERDAHKAFTMFLKFNFEPGHAPAKVNPDTRPMKALAPLMITIVTAQEFRANLGDVPVLGATCSEWIDRAIHEIKRDFFKPRLKALMEVVGPKGEIYDHFDGRMLNPGHAIECAWFILHEAKIRGDNKLAKLGLSILDGMWDRGWDREFGGFFYFRDLRNLPVQEYWQDMKFWWPHNEAIIATLLAWRMTGDKKYARWHKLVHDWSFKHFADPRHGEWFGYLRRDGTPANTLKGSLWKGPFHLPRMLWYCWQLLEEA
ncbi:MAG: AGE family epimerase/isomerase [Verrucomicrobiota bacterium]